MVDTDVLRYVSESLPAAPARVLEVGAGDGELAAALRSAGYDVVAIDPASSTDSVRPIPLHELGEPPASFDAAVAVVSMHHVEPLRRSCRVLAEVVRPGGALVLDEIDVGRFDDSAERWWLENRPPDHDHNGHEPPVPGSVVAFLRHHCHHLDAMEDALVEWFELGPLTRGPYLYRWQLGPALRVPEQELIAAGGLPAVGVRVVGTRRPGPA
jgi:SAM-dependent methyltransferase